MTELDDAPSGAPSPRDEAVDGSRYRLGEELARGGVGRVRLAVDERLGRTVAIKQLLTPLPATRARFEREARITARLEHPGVVPVYDRGVGDDGEPFYVMRRVAGRTLAEAIHQCADLRARLALIPIVQGVADTLAYAHEQEIIHRDLKPSNVLVGDHGETLVIDWGLAKQIGDTDPEPLALGTPEGGELTHEGAVMGTPAYMAPEQAAGGTCDARSDVYSLGALLAHVLAGAPTKRPLRELVRGCPVDLLAIVERAMAPAPEDRYPNAGALAADLRAFSNHQLVSAHSYTLRERFVRWVRRHRTAVAVGAPLIVALLVTGVIAAQRVRVERDRAVTALHALEGRDRELALRQAETVLERDPTPVLAWVASAHATGDDEWRARSLLESAVSRGVAHELYAIDGVGPATDGNHVVSADAEGNVWTWSGSLSRLAVDLPRPRAIAIGHGRVVVGSDDGTITAFDATTGTRSVLKTAGGPPIRACFVAAVDIVWCGDTRGTLRRHGPVPYVVDLEGALVALAVRGDRFAAGLDDGTIVVGDPSGSRRLTSHTRSIGQIRFLDDATLLTGAEDGRVLRWTLATGVAEELAHHDDWISSLAVSEDGKLLATGSGDRSIHVTSLVPGGSAPTTLRGHRAAVLGLAWRGDTLASTALDGTLRLWRPGRGSIVIPAPGVRRLVWLEGAVLGFGSTLRVWTELPPIPDLPGESTADVLDAAVSADGRWLAITDRDRHLRAWSLTAPAPVWQIELSGMPSALRFVGPDELVAATEKGSERWNLTQKTRVSAVETSGTQPVIFRDGRFAIIEPAHSAVAIHGPGDAVQRFGPISDQVALALAPDESALVVGDIYGHVTRFTIATGAREQLGTLTHIEEIQISADGAWTIVHDRGGAVWAWPRKGAGHRIETGGDASAIKVAGHGALIAVGDTLVLADLETRSGRRWRGHRSRIEAIELTPEGLAVTSDHNGELRATRLRDGATAVVPGRFRPGTPIAFAPDRRIIAHTADNAIALVAIPELRAPSTPLETWLDKSTVSLTENLEAVTPTR